MVFLIKAASAQQHGETEGVDKSHPVSLRSMGKVFLYPPLVISNTTTLPSFFLFVYCSILISLLWVRHPISFNGPHWEY